MDPVTSAAPPRWRLATRLAFRFFAVYFTLYVVATQMLGGFLVIPTPAAIAARLNSGMQRFFYQPMERAVVWTGTHIFHTNVPTAPSGSGDRMFNWVQVADLLIIAAIAALVWSLLDRRRERYDRTYRWFRVFLRFALGTTLISYGFAKAFPLQMPAPQLTRLLEPFGNFSPMGVLWYSIGASFPYERFVGIVEVVAGALLFAPRTQLAGALLALGATVEVFVLNMTYDVPVKLFAFHLVVMAVFLIAPYAKTICAAVFSVRSRSILAAAAQILLGVWMIRGEYKDGADGWAARGPNAPKPPLYGIWTIEKMKIDGVERLPLVTDYERWRRVIVQNAAQMHFWRMDDSFMALNKKIDGATRTITLTRGTEAAGSLVYQQVAPDQLVFDGTIDKHVIHMETRLFDHNKMLLKTRGFNWVQEQPFNR